MSVVTRRSRGRNRSVSTTAVSVVLGLFVLLFLVRFGQQILLENELTDKGTIERRINAQLKDQNNRLKASLQYFQSTKYIEQRAREDLNLRGQNEEVLIPTGFDDTAASGGANSVKATPSTQAVDVERPTNAENWFQLFQAPVPASTSP